MEEKLAALKERLAEINDIESANAVLGWDQAVCQPPGGADARGRQSATLARLAHEKLADPAVGSLLDSLSPWAAGLPPDSPDAALIRAARRDYEKAARVPPELMGRMVRHAAASYEAWTRARPANDFAAVRPFLEQTLELSRTYAGYFPGYAHPADPLIDIADPGSTAAELSQLFTRLRGRLVPLVREIAACPCADESPLHGDFPADAQVAFGLAAAERIGFDTTRGRLDRSPHPFTTRFSIGDVRITTRVREDSLGDALFSTLHEAGHAMYEQGVDPSFEATPLARGVSSAIHESQSRLWENLVGRSRPFWRHFFPLLRAAFPGKLDAVTEDGFYRAMNAVRPSLIRTDSDEVTYNLHVMIRFDLELALLEGKLSVRDLPEAWRERYRTDLGVVPPDDRDGVLQDVHWFSGTIGGAFQGYTLGNILSAQFFKAAVSARPQIPRDMERGEFGALRDWLAGNLYRHGNALTPGELILRATGSPLTVEPYLDYLRTKYGELFSLTP
jgi:carboxypeptidase Taq